MTKNTSLLVLSLLCLLIVSVACKGTKPYSSSTDKFSITFPSGTKEIVLPNVKDFKNGIVERRYNTTNKNGGYEVVVTTFSEEAMKLYDSDKIMQIALGFEKGKILEKNETSFQDCPAIASRHEFNASTRTSYVRSLIIWVDSEKKLFSIRALAYQKPQLDSAETNNFYNSFQF